MGEELVADNEEARFVEEGRLTGEGCWFWKRKLKLQWLQGEGDITNEKRVESPHSSGTGGTRDPGGVIGGQKHSQLLELSRNSN